MQGVKGVVLVLNNYDNVKAAQLSCLDIVVVVQHERHPVHSLHDRGTCTNTSNILTMQGQTGSAVVRFTQPTFCGRLACQSQLQLVQ